MVLKLEVRFSPATWRCWRIHAQNLTRSDKNRCQSPSFRSQRRLVDTYVPANYCSRTYELNWSLTIFFIIWIGKMFRFGRVVRSTLSSVIILDWPRSSKTVHEFIWNCFANWEKFCLFFFCLFCFCFNDFFLGVDGMGRKLIYIQRFEGTRRWPSGTIVSYSLFPPGETVGGHWGCGSRFPSCHVGVAIVQGLIIIIRTRNFSVKFFLV